MLKALFYCHEVVGVLHKDIKPDNIVIGHDHKAVLIDFGLAETLDEFGKEKLKLKAGSYLFMAPEIFEERDSFRP